jgi:hypothetical protein
MRRKHAAAEPSRVGYAACATWAIEDDNHDHGYTRLGEHSSGNSVKVTLDRLEAMLKAKGITVFARIDHAAGAAAVGMPVRPSGLLIFGDPTAGTGPMQPEQTIGHRPAPQGARLGRCERWRVDLLRCPSVASGTAGLHHGSADAVHAIAVHATVGVLAKFDEVAAGA